VNERGKRMGKPTLEQRESEQDKRGAEKEWSWGGGGWGEGGTA